jgi:hypothetical protein
MEQTNFAETQQSDNLGESNSSGASTPATQEKLIPQSKVNEIVRHSNARVAEKARREAAEHYQSQALSSTYDSVPNAGLTAEQLHQQFAPVIAQEVDKKLKVIQDQATEYANLQAGHKILNDFTGKLEAAKADYPEIEKTIQSLPLVNMPSVVRLAAEVDNTAGVMTELDRNPAKIAQIEELAKIDPSLRLARNAMKQLADSVRINDEAKKVKTANEPLSQIQPSPTGMDNGSPSLKDLKRLYRG